MEKHADISSSTWYRVDDERVSRVDLSDLVVMRMVDQLVSCTDENVDSWHVCSGLDHVRLLDMVDELVAHICYNMFKKKLI